jgi:hypothetical protein
MISAHSCTHVATRMVEAQGCLGLVAKAGQRWPMGHKSPGATTDGGHTPMKQASWGGAWVVKSQGLNNPGLEQALGALSGDAQEEV